MSEATYHAAVFGATSSIASETLRAIVAERNAYFLLIGRNHDRLEAVASDLRTRGAQCEILEADLLSPDADWKSHLEGREWDLILLAHGSLPDQGKSLTNPHDLGREMDINLLSPLRIMAASLPVFEAQQRGTLAVFGSVAGDRGRQSNFLYGSAKAGVETFVEGLRHRLSSLPSVSVVLLKPGMTDTPMTAHLEKGPLFSPAEKVGQDAWSAIKNGRAVAYLPGWWWFIMTAVKLLPRPLFHKTSL
ncbi:MAG: SDR family NAD(P)-dependent oxidoreductase [Verrucomicrobiota bacterium]